METRTTRAMPSLLASSLRVFDLSLGEMLWSRRTVFLALIVGGPVVISIILRIVDLMNVPAMTGVSSKSAVSQCLTRS